MSVDPVTMRDTRCACPHCGLIGSEAMIPDRMMPGDPLLRVRRGMRWECGTTEDVQSRMCANIVERVAAERERIVAIIEQAIHNLRSQSDDDAIVWNRKAGGREALTKALAEIQEGNDA